MEDETPSPPTVAAALLQLSGDAWRRLRARIEGLSDSEYFWEPVDGCWTIRPGPDGVYRPDLTVLPLNRPPVTTIAWRLAHVTDILGQERNATWLGLESEVTDDMTAEPTAAGAIERLDRTYGCWERLIRAVDDPRLLQPIGRIGGPYSESTRLAFVLHELDELIHHGAEVGVLRDLYRDGRATEAKGTLVTALLRADRAAVAEASMTDSEALARVLADHPDLVARASAKGRFDAVRLLVELGFDVNAKGDRTALHDAAGVGDLAMVRFLVEHGADPDAVDDLFERTPLGWARYLGRADVVEYLRATSSR